MRSTIFALAVLVSFVGAAHAQGHADLDIGVIFPTGDLADDYDGKFSVNARYMLEAGPTVGYGLQVGYNTLGLGQSVEDMFESIGFQSVSGGDLSLLTFDLLAELKVGAADRVALSLFGGGGILRLGASDLELDDGDRTTTFEFDSEWKLCGTVGAMFRVPMGTGLRLGLSAAYRLFILDELTDELAVADTGNYVTLSAVISTDL